MINMTFNLNLYLNQRTIICSKRWNEHYCFHQSHLSINTLYEKEINLFYWKKKPLCRTKKKIRFQHSLSCRACKTHAILLRNSAFGLVLTTTNKPTSDIFKTRLCGRIDENNKHKTSLRPWPECNKAKWYGALFLSVWNTTKCPVYVLPVGTYIITIIITL